MNRQRALLLWLGALVLVTPLGACGRDPSPVFALRDTEGRRFEARCDPRAGCRIQQTGGPREPGGRSGSVLHRQALLTVVCSVTPGSVARDDVRDCRALECATDRECPPEPGGPRFGHCINGLCVDPAGAVSEEDSAVLCLAGKGLGRESRAQVEAYSMGINCGSPCTVPRPCRQP